MANTTLTSELAKRGVTGRRQRLINWAMGYRGFAPVTAMTNPPIITESATGTSLTTGRSNASNIPARGLFPQLQIAGQHGIAVQTGNPNNNAAQFLGPNDLTGTPRGSSLTRVRFMIESPTWDVCFVEQTGSLLNAIIDDEFVSFGDDARFPVPLQSGQVRNMQFDHGADVSSQGVVSTAIANGGAGNAVGDILTATGGTFTRAAKYKVASVSAGAVTRVVILDPGNYSALPSNPVTVTTGGSGTPPTIINSFYQRFHSTLKPRRVELLIQGAWLYGVDFMAQTESGITPYRFNPHVPKLYWIGDSQDSNTYGYIAGVQIGHIVSRKLGLSDGLIIDGAGGTGFNTPNGNVPAFEHPNRVNACIAAAPNIVFFPYSQNVGANTQAQSQTAALAFLSALQIALPDTLFIMCGPAYGFQSWHLAAMQYVMANAPDPRRIRMIDSISEGWATTSTASHLTTDNTHLGNWSNVNWRANLIAEGIASAICDMVLNY